MGSGGGTAGIGPCGACKFLRRKCVKSCIFAPYFDSDQGTAHFAAVHRVFGASNATKLLLRLPPHRRLDAVVTLCYEALARVRDPVYGCVGHIFTLQQQVLNLQAELAYVQARIAMLHHIVPPPPPQLPEALTSSNFQSSAELVCINNSTIQNGLHFDVSCTKLEASNEMVSNSADEDQLVDEDGGLQSLAREYVYYHGPPTSL